MGHRTIKKVQPFRVTLLSISGRAIQLGEHMVYEVMIENTSPDPVVIPWNPDRGTIIAMQSIWATSTIYQSENIS